MEFDSEWSQVRLKWICQGKNRAVDKLDSFI